MGNKPNAADLHIEATLVHLPYDADKLADVKGLEFKQGASTGVKGANDDFYSFKDNEGQTRYFKKIAQSEEAGKDADKNHDAAAFVEIDRNGEKIKDAAGKNKVIAVFPGLNNPGSDINEAWRDMNRTTSYSNAFYDKFKQNYEAGLEQNGIKTADIKAIGHSMGDKYAFEFAAENKGAQVTILAGWDSRDALVGAALRKTGPEEKYEDAKGFKEQLSKNIHELTENVIDIRAKHDRKEQLTDNSYHVEGTRHRAKSFLNIKDDQIEPAGKDVKNDELVEYALKKAKDFALDTLKNDLKEDGKYTHEDRKAFHQAKHLFKETGLKTGGEVSINYAHDGVSSNILQK